MKRETFRGRPARPSSPRALVAAAATGLALASAGFSSPPASAADEGASKAAARAVVGEFFRTINAGRFAKTCDMMSARFFRENHIPNKRRCALGLKVTFAMTAAIDYRIVSIRSGRGEVVVRAIAKRGRRPNRARRGGRPAQDPFRRLVGLLMAHGAGGLYC
jgi:hypothetical protein